MHQTSLSMGLDGLLTAALDCAPVGLIVLNTDRSVRLVTAAAAHLLGLAAADRVVGMCVDEALASATGLAADSLHILRAALSGQIGAASGLVLTTEGPAGLRIVSADIRPAGRFGWVLSLEDVTCSRQTQDWLLEHAASDQLTGVWNRQHFMLMLHDRLAIGAAPAVLQIGLQRLKQINNLFGLATGDTLLRQVAARLSGVLLADDMVARFAGDEFICAIDLPGCSGAIAENAQRIAACLAQPYTVDGQKLSLGIHIGVACAPRDGLTAEVLAGNAALALQQTMLRDAAAIRFFEPAFTEQARLRRSLETDLRHALARGEFELHYQPQVDVITCRVTGLEALIRWRHPQRGLVPPIEFISLAEQLDLITEIGDWVLREACREAALWPNDMTVAVNASPLQFESGHFARSVGEALAAAGLPASRLEIEITESLLLRDTAPVLSTLAALHAMGVRLVLDDFGTGFASLSQLSRFRFDKIKIDRSFVSPVQPTAENSAIVRSIAALGQSLGIPTTAEGVETAGQLAQIKADGCTSVQGYFYSRPVPSGDVSTMLDRLHQI